MGVLKKILIDIFTEPGELNHQVCPARVIGVLGAFCFLGLGIAHYVQHSVFEPQQFALGFGSIMAGLGVALGLKRDSGK
jgi:hypothetical protein